jgi:DNA-binding MarR family transcriptional regulator
MVSDRLLMLEASKALNAKVVSLPRLELMGLLADVQPDGAEYRELKAALKVGDGKLVADLNTLIDMGYVASKSIKVERKKLTSYHLTPDGVEAWQRTRRWLLAWMGAT